MIDQLQGIAGAVMDVDALVALADVRCDPNVQVILSGSRAWVTWQASNDAVLKRLLGVRGAELYRSHEGSWQRLGSRLPATGIPFTGEARPLRSVLLPAPFQAIEPDRQPLAKQAIRLLPSEQVQATRAVWCDLHQIAAWAETVSSYRLGTLEAAWRGLSLLVRGPRLPTLLGGERYWGDTILVPLGQRLDPQLPESVVREALGVQSDEIVRWMSSGPELIPRKCFQRLTRAGIRLARDAAG